MSNRSADDFEAIRTRLAELKKEREEAEKAWVPEAPVPQAPPPPEDVSIYGMAVPFATLWPVQGDRRIS